MKSLANLGNKRVRKIMIKPADSMAATEISMVVCEIQLNKNKSNENTSNPATDVPKAKAFHGTSA